MPMNEEPGFFKRQMGNLEQYIQDVLSGDVMRRGIQWGDTRLGGGLQGIKEDPMQFVGAGGGGLLSPMARRATGLLGKLDPGVPVSPRQQYMQGIDETQQEARNMIRRLEQMQQNPGGRPDLSPEDIQKIVERYNFERAAYQPFGS